MFSLSWVSGLVLGGLVAWQWEVVSGKDFPHLPHDTDEVFAALLGEAALAPACRLGEARGCPAGGFGHTGRPGNGRLGEQELQNAVKRQALIGHVGRFCFYDEFLPEFLQCLQAFTVEVHQSNRLPEGAVRSVLALPFITTCCCQRTCVLPCGAGIRDNSILQYLL